MYGLTLHNSLQWLRCVCVCVSLAYAIKSELLITNVFCFCFFMSRKIDCRTLSLQNQLFALVGIC